MGHVWRLTPATPAAGHGAALQAVSQLLVGQSAVMESLRALVATVAPTDASVLVQGPTGSGKEVVAQALHAASGRKGALVPVNCAAIPTDLLEAELFGHEKGAFTGADRQRIGRIEMADAGTLFLDEIGDMHPTLQAKLLRVLETRQIQRLGSTEEIPVDFRLVTATHRGLREQVARGGFREDLFYRISVFPVDVPSLAERRTDVPLLLAHMIDLWLLAYPDAGVPHFTEDAIAALMAHSWPGNVRELRNLVERAMVLFPDRIITAEHLQRNLFTLSMPLDADRAPAPATASARAGEVADAVSALRRDGRINLRSRLRDLEVTLIETALDVSAGNVSRASEVLMLHRTTLIEKLRKYGIQTR